MDAKIKNKEDSLAALMTRILKEPLNPIDNSLGKIKEGLLDLEDSIESIQDAVSDNESSINNLGKNLNREIISLKNEILPDQLSVLHGKITEYCEKSNKAIQTLETHYSQQAIDLKKISQDLSEFVSWYHDQQQVSDAACQRQLSKIEENTVRLHTEIKYSTDLLGTSIDEGKTLSTSLKKSSLAMLVNLKNLEQDGHTNTNTVNHNQQELIQLLTQQNTDLIAHLTVSQSKLKNLTFLMSIVFVVMLGYVGYGIWDKLS